MTYWCEYYNCCPCCDQRDDWHLTEGRHKHEEPCEVCDDA
jgi:hypothetical protein